jgi:hypothetical protein
MRDTKPPEVRYALPSVVKGERGVELETVRGEERD